MPRLLIFLTLLVSSLSAQLSNTHVYQGEAVSAKKASFGGFMTAENGSFYTFGADYIGPEPFKSTGEFHIRKYDIETLDLQSDIELNELIFEICEKHEIREPSGRWGNLRRTTTSHQNRVIC